MAQENRVGDLVVRLLDGRSEQRVLALEAGQAQRPFAVGRQSNWTVDAPHVAAAHVILAFNGSELYVCAVRGERALLDGKPLGPTPRVKVSVSPGTHTVLFVNAEESLKKSVTVTIAAGETKAVSAKLRD